MGTQNPQIISENIVLIAGSNTWIEGNAIQQFQNTARLPQMRRVAGMPDLHAGRGYPVGAAFFSFGCFYPALIGNDIGCGMALWQTDLPAHKAKPAKLAKQLGSIDAPLDESRQARINAILPQHPFQVALGSIGGGNHFAELQTVDTVYRPEKLPENFDTDCLQLLVHSGSRRLGQQVFCAAMWTRTATKDYLKTAPKPISRCTVHTTSTLCIRNTVATASLCRWCAFSTAANTACLNVITTTGPGITTSKRPTSAQPAATVANPPSPNTAIRRCCSSITPTRTGPLGSTAAKISPKIRSSPASACTSTPILCGSTHAKLVYRRVQAT
ncbi:RtcB family protein [Eikenella sp. NML01-A-086]|uniref:RtcB family protein n=1 Tax=Eikenella sp. NML01-A-086 TaxID=1795826 RepID=UPI000B1A1F67